MKRALAGLRYRNVSKISEKLFLIFIIFFAKPVLRPQCRCWNRKGLVSGVTFYRGSFRRDHGIAKRATIGQLHQKTGSNQGCARAYRRGHAMPADVGRLISPSEPVGLAQLAKDHRFCDGVPQAKKKITANKGNALVRPYPTDARNVDLAIGVPGLAVPGINRIVTLLD